MRNFLMNLLQLLFVFYSTALWASENGTGETGENGKKCEDKVCLGGVLWSRYTASDHAKAKDFNNGFAIARFLIDFEYKLSPDAKVRVVPDFQINNVGEESWFGLRNGYFEKKFGKNFKITTGIHRIHFLLDYPNHFPEKVLREKEKFFAAKGVGLGSNGLGASMSLKLPEQKLFFDTGVYASASDGYKIQTKAADGDEGKAWTFLMGTNPIPLFEVRLSFLYERYRNDSSYPKINTMSDQYAAGVIVFYNYGRTIEPGFVMSLEHMLAYDQKIAGTKSRLYEVVLGWQWNYVLGTLFRFDRFEPEVPGAKTNLALSRFLTCLNIQFHSSYRLQLSYGAEFYDDQNNRTAQTAWVQLQTVH